MIRVAFILNNNNKVWNGGLNYYRNLFKAICDLPDKDVEPVIITGERVDRSAFPGYPDIEIIRSSIFDRYSPCWFLQRSVDHLFSRDILIEPLLKKNKIKLLSHVSFLLNPYSSIPTCVWIPDLQIIRCPEFFSKEEIVIRMKSFNKACDRSTIIILSSFDAQKDLMKFAPEMVGKSRVMQFVSYPDPEAEQTDLKTLQRKYNFQGSFFLLPNQFWVHKNHRVVVEALKILAARRGGLLVLAPGKQYDSRHAKYPEELMELVQDSGVSQYFRPLGEIPYSDLSGLMINSVSMINPSFFEGWSTTVEEAKSLGKQIILSDIPVHREQTPPDGIYFDPNNAEKLADILWDCLITYDPDRDLARRLQAKEQFPRRWTSFGKTYNNIVIDAIEPHSL